MKKVFLILAACMLLGMAFSSCNREICPAYSHAETELPAENI